MDKLMSTSPKKITHGCQYKKCCPASLVIGDIGNENM